MSEITINSQTYRTGKLNALQQLHVSRRLAPILATMGISLHQLASGMSISLDEFMPVLGPISEMMARMPEDDVNYIIFTCLATVERKQSDMWAPCVSGSNLMFQDMDLPTMMRLVVEVCKDNLGGFLKGLGEPANSPSP